MFWKIVRFFLQFSFIGELIISTVAQACPIYLTIGLDGKIYQESALQLNWASDCYVRPEWYGIYTEEPSSILLDPYIRIQNVSDGIHRLAIKQKVGKLKFPLGWNRNDNTENVPHYKKMKCLDYYVASFRGNELLSVECLKIYPNWMRSHEGMGRMQLKNLFIPGTHASGAYLTNYGATKSIFIKEHAISQYFDVWSQLVFGIRYLDLSIGVYKASSSSDPLNPEKFWIVNENMFINQLRFILKDVRKFVALSGEVVILDFSSFPIGFYKRPEVHMELYSMINRELGSLAYQHNDSTVPCYNLTIDDIVNTNRTIIILYPLDELPHPANESPILCQPWKRFSTGFMNTSQALDYMRLLFSKKKSSPVQDEGWTFNAIKSMEQSLNMEKLQTAKERALHINSKVSNWLRGPWGKTANVVTLDYFSSTNIIDVAINANIHKAFLKSNKNYVHFEITV
ncbi:uncharacterized protein LOC106087092 [Stomoxys calcitrans]|uniref:uncharacterized protein LOC106087092 n=1 Tax=Stomoxys calcitrans TaxID=35570 RepID=UPI0027E36564|nr:uncharacterized protein LOC106087092 [Stomoxys calcitrans]